jgi:hypothetical protein
MGVIEFSHMSEEIVYMNILIRDGSGEGAGGDIPFI